MVPTADRDTPRAAGNTPFRQTNGQALGLTGTDESLDGIHLSSKHDPVQEEYRAESLILRRCADVSVCRQRRQKRRHVIRAKRVRVLHAVVVNVAPNPRGVGRLGAPAVMPDANGAAYLLHRLGAGVS